MREITRGLASLMGIALLAHCSRSAPEPLARSTALFSDAAHGGNPHFYLLPPIVPAPAWSGIFDGTLSPVVIVCRLSGSACAAITARFSMTGGTGAQTVRVDSANELYIVNWHTDECLTGPCTLPDGGLYRVKVTVAGALLGFADLEVVASRAEAKKVDANEYFALLDGRTVPIKFRIEKGAISLLPPSGGAAQVGPGGGAVAISNGAASLVFPPGALTSTVSISLSPAAAWPLTEMVGAVYDLGPDGASFASPVTLGIAWPGPAAGVDESKLELSTAETGDLWEAVSGASVDTAAHSASGPITHFSKGAVLGPVRAVTVSPGSVSLVAGSGVQLAATTTPTNHKVKWMVSNPAVASVSATGLVNGVSPGTATITARSGAASGTAAVSVAPPAPAITSPPSGISTTGGAIAVSGTANPGAAIDIFDGAGLVASASADLSGSFSVAVSLEIGMHSLTAQQTINGETSAASSTVSVEVKPPAPAITAPVNLFDTTSTTLAIAGTGVPGATIALADGGNGSLAIPAGPITVDAGGIWSVTATLGYGAHRLGAIQIRNGEASVASDALEGHVRPAAPAIVSPASGTARTNSSVAVSGAAIANASVTLFDGGSAVASVTADGGGLFGAIVSLAIGPHALRNRAIMYLYVAV